MLGKPRILFLFPNSFNNSIKHEHSCKILYLILFPILLCLYHNVQVIKVRLSVNCSVSLILIDFSLTVKAATLIFTSGRGSAISCAKEGKSGFIYSLVKGK